MVKSKKNKGPKAPAATLTPEQLYEQAQVAIQYEDYDTAIDCLKRAARQQPNNPEIVTFLGCLLAETGSDEEAKLVLKHAVRIAPDQGHEKFMYLAQLLEGDDAIRAVQQGISILQRTVQSAEEANSADVADLRKALCQALCELAELQMHTAEDVSTVAEEVQQVLQQARQLDPKSPEPGQTLASLQYEQGRMEEAFDVLKQSMSLWFKPHKAEDEEEGEDDMDDEGEAGHPSKSTDAAAMDEDQEEGPSPEFRFECAKLLLELDESTETAIQVIEDLIEEDDMNPDVWHLLALAYYSGHQYEEAQEVLQKGAAVVKKLGIPEDEEIVDSFKELEAAVAEAMSHTAPQQQ